MRRNSNRPDPSPATAILWGQILIVSLVVLVFLWAATQWVAFRLGHQPALGVPLTDLFGWPVSAPGTSSSGGTGTTPMRRPSSSRAR